MAQRRKSGISKAETVTAAVKAIEMSSKKQLAKINAMRHAEEQTIQTEHERLKAELELVKKADPNVAGWADQALGIADHMKTIIRKESEMRHQMLLKTDEVSKDLEMRIYPIRKELPSILDFSEEDRVHLNLTMDKALQEVAKMRKEIEEDEIKLQKQMSVLIHNTPDPAAPKDQTITKLSISYDTMVIDPEAVRSELLANIARGNSSDNKSPSPPVKKHEKATTPTGHHTKQDHPKK